MKLLLLLIIGQNLISKPSTNEFILNNQLIKSNQPSISTMVDVVRYHKILTGTKIGCREGD
jgi:xanthine dehydrogenase iron-sulfur cluster and FAD-binding subunit A